MSDQILEQLETEFRGFLLQEATNRQDWVEIQISKCLTLVKMRDKFTADIKFGQWFEPRFGKEIERETRWRAIAMGRQPEALRTCLQATTRSSLRHIHLNDFARFLRVEEPTSTDTAPNNKDSDMSRQDNAADQGRSIIIFAKERGAQGMTTAEACAEFGFKHQSASKRVTLLKQEGTLVATGEKRRFGNGTGDVLVHRDFFTAEMRAKKVKTKGTSKSKGSGKSTPINRAAQPLHLLKNLPREETGMPTDDVANEIDPETGMTRMQAFVQKWGHAQVFPLKQRELMEQRKIAGRLGPQLRELKKQMATFLRTPEAQRDDIVPMPPMEFVMAALEINDGAYIRAKVEEELAALEPVLAEVNAYVAALKTALITVPANTPVADPAVAETRH